MTAQHHATHDAHDPIPALLPFAQWLDERMRQRGIKNNQLANRLGIDKGAISAYRRALRRPNPDKFAALVAFFGESPEAVAEHVGFAAHKDAPVREVVRAILREELPEALESVLADAALRRVRDVIAAMEAQGQDASAERQAERMMERQRLALGPSAFEGLVRFITRPPPSAPCREGERPKARTLVLAVWYADCVPRRSRTFQLAGQFYVAGRVRSRTLVLGCTGGAL